MLPLNKIEILVDHILRFSDKDFIGFADRLLTKIFPGEMLCGHSISDNGYSVINNSLFAVVPLYNKSLEPRKVIPKENISSFSSITLISRSDDSYNQKIKNTIGRFYKIKDVILWGSETIKQKIISLKESDLLYLVGDKSVYSNYLRLTHGDEVSFNRLQLIFDFLIDNYCESPDKYIPDDLELTKIKEKIDLNFNTLQGRVSELYIDSYYYKTLTDKFIKTKFRKDTSPVNLIKKQICRNFCLIANAPHSHSPIDKFIFLEKMAEACLKPQYHTNFDLILMAQGVVMYFFEVCDFGARDEKDVNEYEAPTFPFKGEEKN